MLEVYLFFFHRMTSFQNKKKIQDLAARYVITGGHILSLALNLVSVYGPNQDNPTFFEALLLTVQLFSCVLNPVEDRSTGCDTTIENL